ncbi:MAG: CDP-6-deoxy-delta-3,4-glucoseen reductase [Burkholderiaceae bacterium]
MTFKVTVQPSGQVFNCELGDTVLAAGLRAGVGLPYGCKNGACGTCKGKLVSGKVEHRPHQARALQGAEEEAGMALYCCALPRTDLVIEVREVLGVGDFAVRKMPARVARMERVADDVMVISLQLPATEKLQYHAGQYIEFTLKDGKRRSYSLAAAPHVDEQLSLHIRHMPGGVFTDHVFAGMRERDILRFEGPLGTFFLREDSARPIILIASGTGFAPIKAIIEQAVRGKSGRQMTLYWGGRRPADLYMRGRCDEWARTVPGFRFVPVVSDALPEDAWHGRVGFVHQAVVVDFPDLSAHQVYACGAPIVVDCAKRDLIALCRLPEEEFFADAFTSQLDAPGT